MYGLKKINKYSYSYSYSYTLPLTFPSLPFHLIPIVSSNSFSTYIHFRPLFSSRAFSSTFIPFSKALFIPTLLLNSTPIHSASRSFLVSTSSPPFDTIQYYFCAGSTFSRFFLFSSSFIFAMVPQKKTDLEC
jgi:hypothetical protein